MYKEKLFFLAVSAALLLCALRLLPRRARPMEPVTLCAAADVHYIAAALTEEAPPSDGKGALLTACQQITGAFVEDIAARKPAVLLLTGGLTHHGDRESHEAVSEWLGHLEQEGVPVLVLPGDRDLSGGVDAEGFAELYGAFGYDEALSRDTETLSYTAEVTDQLRVLMLDVNGTAEPGRIPDETLLWVRHQMEEARREGIRMVTAGYRPVMNHNDALSETCGIVNGTEVLALYRQYSNLICAFCGKLHIQHIAEDGLMEIASSSLTAWPNQYGVLSLEGTTAEYAAVPVTLGEDLSGAAQTELWNAAYRQAGADLSGGATVASGIDRLCSFYANVSQNYTAGRGTQIAWDDAVFREWQERGSKIPAYLMSIEADGFHDYTLNRFRFH